MYDQNNIKESWMILTLVDITKTGVQHGTGKQRNQQRNRDTLIQVISMLAQPYNIQNFDRFLVKHITNPWVKFGNRHIVADEFFNNLYCWSFAFSIEHVEALGTHGEQLITMLHNVPIITGLDENAIIDPPVFNTSDEQDTNTFIMPYYLDR